MLLAGSIAREVSNWSCRRREDLLQLRYTTNGFSESSGDTVII